MNLDKLLRFFWKVNEIEDVQRGFASSIDPVPSYIVWIDDRRGYSVTFECICGLSLPVPESTSNVFNVFHDQLCCGYKAKIRLVNYGEWLEGKRPNI